MFALVKFVEDEYDSRYHVVHTSDFDNFEPTNEDDFDKKKIYDMFWIDPKEDGEYTRNCDAQISMMAENREELDTKVAAKTVQVTNRKLIDPAFDASSQANEKMEKMGTSKMKHKC
ncbi:hypothetical protein MTO96_032179 [Rhipicephalus appendiculatus]